MQPLKTDRLKSTYDYIRAYGKKGVTTLDISYFTGSMAVGSDVADLRKKGYVIKCKFERISEEKRKIYRYTIGGV